VGYLLPILLALGSLVLGEFEGLPLARAPWAVTALVPVPYLISVLERRCALSGSFRWAALWGRLGRQAPVLMQYLALGVFGWGTSLEAWFGRDLSLLSWPELPLLAALAPFVVFTLLSIDAEARSARTRTAERRELRSFQVRMFASGLGPIVGYLAIVSLLGQWRELRIHVEEVSLWGVLFTLVLAFAFVLLLPGFLRRTWDTEVLPPGPERDLLERVAELARFRCRELLVWKTGDLVANAAIVGLWPPGRRVFFTDALLGQMGPRQLAAVFAHEIGHAKRRHVLLFVVWALAFFGAVDAGLVLLDLGGEEGELLVLGAAVVVWILTFGWISRRAELEADIYSLELLRDGVGITSALQAVSPAAHSRRGWRHFSTAERIAFLSRVGADPLQGRRLRGRLRAVGLVGALLLLATGIWRSALLVGDYPLQRTVVDLRLGHYAGAAERSRAWVGNEKGEALAALVKLAEAGGLADFETAQAAAARCAELARTSLDEGSLDRAQGWLQLGGLAGDAAAGRAAETLAEHGSEGAPADLEDPSLGPWRGPLRAALGRDPDGV